MIADGFSADRKGVNVDWELIRKYLTHFTFHKTFKKYYGVEIDHKYDFCCSISASKIGHFKTFSSMLSMSSFWRKKNVVCIWCLAEALRDVLLLKRAFEADRCPPDMHLHPQVVRIIHFPFPSCLIFDRTTFKSHRYISLEKSTHNMGHCIFVHSRINTF